MAARQGPDRPIRFGERKSNPVTGSTSPGLPPLGHDPVHRADDGLDRGALDVGVDAGAEQGEPACRVAAGRAFLPGLSAGFPALSVFPLSKAQARPRNFARYVRGLSPVSRLKAALR